MTTLVGEEAEVDDIFWKSDMFAEEEQDVEYESEAGTFSPHIHLNLFLSPPFIGGVTLEFSASSRPIFVFDPAVDCLRFLSMMVQNLRTRSTPILTIRKWPMNQSRRCSTSPKRSRKRYAGAPVLLTFVFARCCTACLKFQRVLICCFWLIPYAASLFTHSVVRSSRHFVS